MKNFIKEFKDFLNRGSLIELSVAVVMGAALKSIVDSLVANLIMPIVSLVSPKGHGFTTWHFEAMGMNLKYGLILESILNFVIVGFAVFILVKVSSKFRKEKEETITKTEQLLEEIRDVLKENNKVTVVTKTKVNSKKNK